MRSEASVDCEAKPLISKHAPAAATAAVVTLAAASDQFHVLDWVAWSYDDTPTGGNIKVEIGGTEVFSIDIPDGGPGIFNFYRPLYSLTKNQAMVITLASGGGAVVGKISTRTR